MLEMMSRVEPRPIPRDNEPHHKLGMLLDAVLVTRRATERAEWDLEVVMCQGPRD